jgi:hypothetical protein
VPDLLQALMRNKKSRISLPGAGGLVVVVITTTVSVIVSNVLLVIEASPSRPIKCSRMTKAPRLELLNIARNNFKGIGRLQIFCLALIVQSADYFGVSMSRRGLQHGICDKGIVETFQNVFRHSSIV